MRGPRGLALHPHPQHPRAHRASDLLVRFRPLPPSRTSPSAARGSPARSPGAASHPLGGRRRRVRRVARPRLGDSPGSRGSSSAQDRGGRSRGCAPKPRETFGLDRYQASGRRSPLATRARWADDRLLPAVPSPLAPRHRSDESSCAASLGAAIRRRSARLACRCPACGSFPSWGRPSRASLGEAGAAVRRISSSHRESYLLVVRRPACVPARRVAALAPTVHTHRSPCKVPFCRVDSHSTCPARWYPHLPSWSSRAPFANELP
jgi:hypothetical protein